MLIQSLSLCADVLAQNKSDKLRATCVAGETPLHEAKTGHILRILLSRTTPEKLRNIDNIPEHSLFDIILKHHPETLKFYLDMMVTSKKDLENDNPHLIFDLSMFDYDQGTTLEANKMDKHLSMIKEGQFKLLIHPVMELFMMLKWHPNVVPYFINFLIFLLFLFVFTAHGILSVNLLQCDNHIASSSEFLKE